MSSDAEDALSWEGDEDVHPPRAKVTLPHGWEAVGPGSDDVAEAQPDDGPGLGTTEEKAEPRSLSTAMLIAAGVFGGIYLLYSIGWAVGAVRLQGIAPSLVSDVMYQVSLWGAILAPVLWFATVWVLTRRSASWIRLAALVGGVLLLVPWPFVMVGVIGS